MRRPRRGPGRRPFPVALSCLAVLLAALPVAGQAGGAPSAGTAEPAAWPREIAYREGTLVLYQPQPERLSGNLLTGRAAASFAAGDGSDPIFGTLWFTARLDADGDEAEVRDIVVDRARWPDVTDERERSVTEYLTGEFATTVVPVDVDRLSASLASAERETRSLEGLKNDPPRIVVSDELAELLLYDGEPRTVEIPDTDLEQVVNVPFAVVRRGDTCYLSGGKIWYAASDPLGPWRPIDAPPSDVSDVVPPDTSSTPAPDPPPAIVTATEPTELIVTDGPPAWTPIGEGDLLYVENTETPILRDVETNRVHVLLSGRWFAAGSLDGPWTFVRSDELPASFAAIPPDSDLGGVRVSVAGTEEAEDAMLDAHVPETAAIRRSSATLEVTWDGDPQFRSIDGTDIEYAVNTSTQVLRIGGRFYACDDGVWFESDAATGPWSVADEIPSEQISQIPPSAPVYNTTYVRVYDSTPDVVYVGYTPGYLWSFPYYGVPVYGTGWYYPPWWGARHYYPGTPSYGLHVGYDPWTGWTFGFTWSSGFMHVGVAFGGGYGGYYRPGWGAGWHGYYPPGGYRRPVVVNTGDVRIGNRVNVGNRVAVGERADVRVRGGGTGLGRRPGVYDREEARARLADPGALADADRVRADRSAGNRANDVLADRAGNLYRRGGDGSWSVREDRQWRPAGGAAGAPRDPQRRDGGARPTAGQVPDRVQRDHLARQRGANRAAFRGVVQPRRASVGARRRP